MNTRSIYYQFVNERKGLESLCVSVCVNMYAKVVLMKVYNKHDGVCVWTCICM